MRISKDQVRNAIMEIVTYFEGNIPSHSYDKGGMFEDYTHRWSYTHDGREVYVEVSDGYVGRVIKYGTNRGSLGYDDPIKEAMETLYRKYGSLPRVTVVIDGEEV